MALQYINTAKPLHYRPVLTKVFEHVTDPFRVTRAQVDQFILSIGEQGLRRTLFAMCDMIIDRKPLLEVEQAINATNDDNLRFILQAIYDRAKQTASYVFARYSDTPSVWYDPSDLSTLYQDSVGTTPVTAVGQPVGLMLDKSRGLVLGSELVSNGTFDSDTAWTKQAGWSISAGAANVNTTGIGTTSLISTGMTVTTGVWYRVTYTIASVAGTGLRVNLGGYTEPVYRTAPGTYTLMVLATTTTGFSVTAGSTNTIATIDNISVRELPGLHASQSTPLNRPVLSSRVNQVLNSGFSGAVAGTPGTAPTSWSYISSTGATDSTTVSDGAGGFVWAVSAVAARHFVSQTPPSLPASSVHDFTATLVATTGLEFQQLVTMAGLPAGATLAYLRNGAVVSGTDIAVAGDVIGVRVTLSTTAGTVTLRIGVGCQSNVTGSASFAKASFVAQNESTLPYQRVTTATDYDADFTKFPPFLSVDGTDDGMVTPSWDLTSTDKVTVVAGVRKLSDAATAVLLELSATTTSNNGSFNIAAPSGIYEYGFTNGGSLRKDALLDSTTYAAPITNVVTTIGSIGTDTTTLRLNGAQVAASAGELGTGTYGNYPLYLFRRGGTTLPFNGRFYGLSIIAAAINASELTALERFQATKTGVILP